MSPKPKEALRFLIVLVLWFSVALALTLGIVAIARGAALKSPRDAAQPSNASMIAGFSAIALPSAQSASNNVTVSNPPPVTNMFFQFTTKTGDAYMILSQTNLGSNAVRQMEATTYGSVKTNRMFYATNNGLVGFSKITFTNGSGFITVYQFELATGYYTPFTNSHTN